MLPLSRPIDESITHGLGSGSEEVPSPFPLLSAAPNQLQPGLMHQRSCLQGVPRRLLGHFVCCQLAHLLKLIGR